MGGSTVYKVCECSIRAIEFIVPRVHYREVLLRTRSVFVLSEL